MVMEKILFIKKVPTTQKNVVPIYDLYVIYNNGGLLLPRLEKLYDHY